MNMMIMIIIEWWRRPIILELLDVESFVVSRSI
jgi:hypothetical protein